MIIMLRLDPRMKRHVIDPCLYNIEDDDLLFFVNVYVDDLIIACNSDIFRDKILQSIRDKFDLTFEPIVTRLCGVDIDYVKGKTVTFSQHLEIADLVAQYKISGKQIKTSRTR